MTASDTYTDKLYYVRWYSTKMGTKGVASISYGNGQYFYKCNLNGDDKKEIEIYHEYGRSVENLECKDSILYYETSETFGGNKKQHKISINKNKKIKENKYDTKNNKNNSDENVDRSVDLDGLIKNMFNKR